MKLKFENQLTTQEINEGATSFILRKMLRSIFLMIGVGAAFALMNRANVNTAQSLVPIGILILVVVGAHFFLRKNLIAQFSPEKVATFIFEDENLEIINAEGQKFQYDLSRMKIINSKNVLLLIFTKNSFAIISKKKTGYENIEEIKNLFKKK
ncbi:hypothetical protein [Fusobacterium sp. PH5-44]|uniref:hypothetical protein n=1 Tax=unclassified Fusobacterium TaxID=2648384 RepID=UPI003D1E8C71